MEESKKRELRALLDRHHDEMERKKRRNVDIPQSNNGEVRPKCILIKKRDLKAVSEAVTDSELQHLLDSGVDPNAIISRRSYLLNTVVPKKKVKVKMRIKRSEVSVNAPISPVTAVKHYDLIVFTDGSAIRNVKFDNVVSHTHVGGTAFIILGIRGPFKTSPNQLTPKNARQKLWFIESRDESYRSIDGDRCTPFCMELSAAIDGINAALRWARENVHENGVCKHIHLYTDAKLIIDIDEKLDEYLDNNFQSRSGITIGVEEQSKFMKLAKLLTDHRIILHKSMAHTGEKYNEMVDRLAKKACHAALASMRHHPEYFHYEDDYDRKVDFIDNILNRIN